MTKRNDHTFAICAYKESPYLEECILSLKNQTVKSNIIMATSTPNEWIQGLAEKYEIPLYINTGEGGIAQDWNFAYRQAKTDYVTIAHQDDIYEPNYLKMIFGELKKGKDPIVVFTDYGELRDGEKVQKSMLLTIKRILLLPMRVQGFQNVRFFKRLFLRFGNPVCCPATTYIRKKFKGDPFEVRFSSNVDWMMLEKQSREEGSFCYISDIGMYHRIHEKSTTTEIIHGDIRWREDYEMFRKFWPAWVAKPLVRVYRLSEKSNNIQQREEK